MVKKSKQAARAYNFKVYIEGKLVSFSKVTGLKGHWDVEPFQEGGRNNTVYKNKVAGKNEGQLTLSRLVTLDKLVSYKPGKRLKKAVEVYLTNDKGKPKKGYFFIGCTIMDVSYSDLDSSQSNVFMEDISIEYQRMETEVIKLRK